MKNHNSKFPEDDRNINARRDKKDSAFSRGKAGEQTNPANVAGNPGTHPDITGETEAGLTITDFSDGFLQIFNAASPMCVIGTDFTILNVNEPYEELFRRKRHDEIGKKCYEQWPGQICRTKQCPLVKILNGAKKVNYEWEANLDDGTYISNLVTAKEYKDPQGKIIGIAESFTDITELKRIERENQIKASLFDVINKAESIRSLIRELTDKLVRWSGCDCVGIRLRDGYDFPYYETRGFPQEFVLVENSLCAFDQKGEIIRDSKGDPVLECMCGNIIMGRFNPSLPFFTKKGSFWTNCTSELLATTTEEDRQSRTRNKCNGEGYESVALIPLRHGIVPIGLMQFNDKRPGRFTQEWIEVLERQAEYIAIALSYRMASESLRESEKHVRELQANVPVGIFRTSIDGYFISVNPAMIKIFGYDSEEELLNTHVSKLYFYPEQRDTMITNVQERRLPGFSRELQMRRKDNSLIWIHINVHVERDENGKIIYVDGMLEDVTSQKNAEKEINERVQFESFLSELSAAFISIPVDEVEKEIEHALQKIIGFLGIDRCTILEFIDNQGSLAATYSYAVNGIDPTLREIISDQYPYFTNRIKKGEVLVINDYEEIPDEAHIEKHFFRVSGMKTNLTIPLFAGGSVLGALAFVSFKQKKTWSEEIIPRLRLLGEIIANAIVRKRTEETLRHSEEKFLKAFHSGATFMAITTIEEGRFIEVNDVFLKAMGYTRDEVIGRTTRELNLFEESVQREQVLAQLKEKKQIKNMEMSLRTKKGEIRDGLFSIDIINLQNKQYLLTTMTDITERKEAETALRSSEERYRHLLESATVGITVAQDGRVKYANKVVEKFTLYTQDDLSSRPFLEFIHPDDRQRIADFHQKRMKGEFAPDKYETRAIAKNGDTRWLHINITPIQWEGRAASLNFVHDITEQKMAEMALKESESRYRGLTENLPVGVYRSSPEGKVIWANPCLVKMFGYSSEEELLKIPAPDFYEDPRDREKLLKILNEEGSVSDFMARGKRKDGSVIWFAENVRAVYDQDEETIHFDGIIRDVTAQKIIQEKLILSEEKYRKIFDTAANLIISADDKGVIVDCNAKIFNFLGYTKDEIIGQPISGIIHEDDRGKAETTLREIIGRGSSYNTEFRFVRKDGNLINVNINCSVLHDIKGNFHRIICLIEDVTERRKMEEELIKKEKLESLGILAGGIAHDFNNILTAILANVSLALVDTEPEGPLYASLFEAQKAISRAHDLTQQLLTFSKGGVPVKRPVIIANIIREAVGFALTGSKTRCEFDIPDDLYMVEADPGQMSQVFHNLIINADQAMPQGGIIRVQANNTVIDKDNVLSLKPGKWVRIKITDQGVGIAEKNLKKVFDPFFTTKQEGSGLGLSSTYSIVKRHDGYIEVESRIDSGTTFTIYLPATAVAEETSDTCRRKISRGMGRVLIMDDDRAVQKVAGKALEKSGYSVDYAGSEQEAIDKFESAISLSDPYDVVILDLTMPGGKGGTEVIKSLRKIDSKIKAIVASGYSNDPVLADYLRYGFSGFIAKPFNATTLAAKVKEILDNDTGVSS